MIESTLSSVDAADPRSNRRSRTPEREGSLLALHHYMLGLGSHVTASWLCKAGAKAFSLDLPLTVAKETVCGYAVTLPGNHLKRWIKSQVGKGYQYATTHHRPELYV